MTDNCISINKSYVMPRKYKSITPAMDTNDALENTSYRINTIQYRNEYFSLRRENHKHSDPFVSSRSVVCHSNLLKKHYCSVINGFDLELKYCTFLMLELICQWQNLCCILKHFILLYKDQRVPNIRVYDGRKSSSTGITFMCAYTRKRIRKESLAARSVKLKEK